MISMNEIQDDKFLKLKVKSSKFLASDTWISGLISFGIRFAFLKIVNHVKIGKKFSKKFKGNVNILKLFKPDLMKFITKFFKKFKNFKKIKKFIDIILGNNNEINSFNYYGILNMVYYIILYYSILYYVNHIYIYRNMRERKINIFIWIWIPRRTRNQENGNGLTPRSEWFETKNKRTKNKEQRTKNEV